MNDEERLLTQIALLAFAAGNITKERFYAELDAVHTKRSLARRLLETKKVD